MKKIVIVLICLVFTSCYKKDEEKKLIYKQMINYLDELKLYSKALDYEINNQNKNKFNEKLIENTRIKLTEFENNFEKLKFKERDKIVKLRNSFNDENKLYVKFDTSNYNENVSDTIFNRLMEIDFYRLKTAYQNRYLIIHGCI